MTENGQNTNQNNTQDNYNALKIPDAIRDLPKFDGNPLLLHQFIHNVERILSLVQQADTTAQGELYLSAIRNKVEGGANEVLNMYGTQLNWDDIKSNLILHYSDKRTETSLIRDLHNLTQNRKSVENFYSEIIEVQSALINNVRIHENNPNVISSKIELFSELCLNAFLSGLSEPLGANIRATRPKSLAEAFSFCIKEQNIFYSRYVPFSKRRNFQNYNRNANYTLNRYNNFQGDFQRNRHTYPTQSYGQNPQIQRPQQNNQNFFKQEVSSNQTRRQQYPQNFKDNYSGHSNFGNRNSGRSQNFRSNYSAPNRRIEESNNINTPHTNPSNNRFQNLDDYQNGCDHRIEELTNIEEPQNFRVFASRNRPDM